MNTIRTIAICFCGGLIASGSVAMLSPSGATEKPMKLLLGIFTILLLISPFTSDIDIDFDFASAEPQQNEDLLDTVNSQITEISAQDIETVAKQILNSYGLECYEIEVLMDISDNSGISITKILISRDKEDEIHDAVALRVLKNGLGTANVEVKVNGQ